MTDRIYSCLIFWHCIFVIVDGLILVEKAIVTSHSDIIDEPSMASISNVGDTEERD